MDAVACSRLRPDRALKRSFLSSWSSGQGGKAGRTDPFGPEGLKRLGSPRKFLFDEARFRMVHQEPCLPRRRDELNVEGVQASQRSVLISSGRNFNRLSERLATRWRFRYF